MKQKCFLAKRKIAEWLLLGHATGRGSKWLMAGGKLARNELNSELLCSIHSKQTYGLPGLRIWNVTIVGGA